MSDKTTIIIPNWRKYQRQLKGNARHRNWFAVSSNIARDPDFMSLSVADRYGWLMLLADASLRGVEQESGECWLELRIKLFRSLYGLRSNFVLEPFINQGFIRIGESNRTGQNSTGHNSTNKSNGASNAPAQMPEEKPDEKHPPLLDNEWTEIRKIYPARKGGQRWPEAEQAAKAHVKRGTITARELYRAVQTYARHCQNTAKTGTEIVMQAGTFFGSGKRFLDEYSDGHEPSRGKAPAPSHFGSDF